MHLFAEHPASVGETYAGHMPSALARKIHSAELEQVTLEPPEPVRPALQVVAGPAAAARHRLTFRWRMDPVERRLVQVWESRD
jgi:hypothetical protein